MTMISEILRQAGFTGQGLSIAEGVSLAESGDYARAHNANAMTGDNSYGLFQINMLGGMGPERRKRYGLKSNDALLDPLTNAKVAFLLSKGGTDWHDWSTYKSGAYHAGEGKDHAITGPGKSAMGGVVSGWGAAAKTQAGKVAGGASSALGIPSADQIGNTATKVGVLLVGVMAGAGLIVLGVNKAAGNPAGKAAHLAGLPGA